MKQIIRFYCYIWLFSVTTLAAQEQIGLRTENYSGVNSLAFNPSAMVTYPLSWDANLVGGGYFGENDFAFVRNTSLLNIARTRNLRINYQLFQKDNFPPDPNTIFFSSDTLRSHALTTAGIVHGPAFAMKMSNNVTMGVFLNGRVFGSAPNLPKEYNYFYFRNRPFNQPYPVYPFSMAAMAWREIGINYAYTKESEGTKWSVGSNVKVLYGHEGFFLNILKKHDISLQPNEQLAGQGIAAQIGYAMSDFSKQDIDLQLKGFGVGIDIGATYVVEDLEEENLYKAKFGAALIDIGAISFKKAATFYEIISEKTFVLSGNDFRAAKDVPTAIRIASQQILGDSTKAAKDTRFSLSLPAALSMQADYALPYHFFIGGLLVQHLTPKNNPMTRPDMLALSPRFDQRWFGAGIPLIWYNWRDFRTGLYARIGFLTIGTDNLGSIFGKRDVTGTDFYASIKINPFNIPWLQGKTDSMYDKKNGKRMIGCHKF
jgi:Family of unknown function (DUF5723)